MSATGTMRDTTPLFPCRAGHLVADGKFPLFRDVHFRELHDARREFVSELHLVLFVLELLLHRIDLLDVRLEDLRDQSVLPLVVHPFIRGIELLEDFASFEQFRSERRPCTEDHIAVGIAHAHRFFAVEEDGEFPDQALAQVGDDLSPLPVERIGPSLVFALGLRVFLLAAEQFRRNDDALHSGRRFQRRILHIAGLFSEDRLQQFFFGRGIGFALRRDLADQDVPFDDFRTDTDDAVLVEILRRFLADVRNFPRQFLFAAFRVADLKLEFFDVDRRKDILRNNPFADDNRIFEVVSAPRHEGHEDVPTERELAVFGGAPVRQDVALLHLVSRLHHGFLIDAGVLVCPEEFRQMIFHTPLVVETT